MADDRDGCNNAGLLHCLCIPQLQTSLLSFQQPGRRPLQSQPGRLQPQPRLLQPQPRRLQPQPRSLQSQPGRLQPQPDCTGQLTKCLGAFNFRPGDLEKKKCKKETITYFTAFADLRLPAYLEVPGIGSNCQRFWFAIKQSYWFFSHSFPFSITVFRDATRKYGKMWEFFPSRHFSAFLCTTSINFSKLVYISMHFSAFYILYFGQFDGAYRCPMDIIFIFNLICWLYRSPFFLFIFLLYLNTPK